MKKTIFITGSTDGIGKLAAIQLAKEGHQVIFHGRSQQKLTSVLEEAQRHGAKENISGYVADLSDLKAVRQMALQIKADWESLDVFINNAGVFKSTQLTNGDGIDLRMVVNYLAPYVLTQELMPLLEKGKEARLINLSSAAQAPVSEAILQGKANSSNQETYAQSKLAITIWSFHLAKKLDDILVIPVNPGSLLNTRMVMEGYGRYWSPAEKGSQILYDLAIKSEYASHSGKYYDNDLGGFGTAHADAYDQTKIDQLITSTEKVLGGLI
ncbi:MAG: SDR family NAD(P)-dependent oxidoreductase [Bacteroidota bacterium]